MKFKCFILLHFILIFEIVGYSQAWSQLGSDIQGSGDTHLLGWSVSLSAEGTTLVVGAIVFHFDPMNSGYARVYRWSNGSWIQKGLDIMGDSAGDQFGRSVCLDSDGNTLLVGAPTNDHNGSDAGQVKVYSWDGGTWIPKGNAIYGESSGDWFGKSVSLSADGNIFASGSIHHNNLNGSTGQVKVYAWNGNKWLQKGTDIFGIKSSRFGHVIRLSNDGSTLAVGAPYYDTSGYTNAGLVRVYQWDGTAWQKKGNDLVGDSFYGDFGWSVDLNSNGTTLAVGIPARHTVNGYYSGQVRVYRWDGSEWQLIGNAINGKTDEDQAGWSVSLNSDGNSVVLGATSNIAPQQSAGKIQVYNWSDTGWMQKGYDINGDSLGDAFGHSVAISANGNVVAAGGIFNDENELDAGHARAYSYFPVGVFENNSIHKLSIYPNPNAGSFSIDLGHTPPSLVLTITDLAGQLIASQSFQNTDFITANLKGPKGIYLVTITTSDRQSATMKVVKE